AGVLFADGRRIVEQPHVRVGVADDRLRLRPGQRVGVAPGVEPGEEMLVPVGDVHVHDGAAVGVVGPGRSRGHGGSRGHAVGAGTSSAGLRSKKPSGLSQKPSALTFIIGQSSGRGTWVWANTYQATIALPVRGRSASVQAGRPSPVGCWLGYSPAA